MQNSLIPFSPKAARDMIIEALVEGPLEVSELRAKVKLLAKAGSYADANDYQIKKALVDLKKLNAIKHPRKSWWAPLTWGNPQLD